MKNRLIEKISGKQEIAKLNLLCFPYAGAGAQYIIGGKNILETRS